MTPVVQGVWFLLILRGLFWALAIVLMTPVLLLCRVDGRIDYAEDLAFGYDDNDPGEDIDEH